MSGEAEKFVVVIVDAFRLRRRGIVRLLQDWAKAEGLEISAIAPSGLSGGLEDTPQARMVILSIGGQPIADPEIGSILRALDHRLADAPLVFISDRDDGAEAIEAFRVGASGFLPTSMDPIVALEALTFILHGGTFFPPAALLAIPQGGDNEAQVQPLRRTARSLRTEGNDNGLTSRQRDVASLLSQGLGNKLIARQLSMTEATVKVHVRQIMRKLGAANRTQAALLNAHSKAEPPASPVTGDIERKPLTQPQAKTVASFEKHVRVATG